MQHSNIAAATTDIFEQLSESVTSAKNAQQVTKLALDRIQANAGQDISIVTS
jgi:hypothetical protein